jgi:hypothetical protein
MLTVMPSPSRSFHAPLLPHHTSAALHYPGLVHLLLLLRAIRRTQ